MDGPGTIARPRMPAPAAAEVSIAAPPAAPAETLANVTGPGASELLVAPGNSTAPSIAEPAAASVAGASTINGVTASELFTAAFNLGTAAMVVGFVVGMAKKFFNWAFAPAR